MPKRLNTGLLVRIAVWGIPGVVALLTIMTWTWLATASAHIEVLRKLVLAFGLIGVTFGILGALLISRRFAGGLGDSLQQLLRGSEYCLAASRQISSAEELLANGTSSQAASIEETSSSLEEISAMVRKSSQNAQEASSLSEATMNKSDICSSDMLDMATAIADIIAANKETQKIVKVIDGIAFQTNLLALNAAVEAARAGEAGAGFAVVADEVRSLAMRAAEAAHTTGEQIQGTTDKINSAMDIVTKSLETFSEVTENTVSVNTLVKEIAEATAEQARGIEQINGAVSEIDQVLQQNAASAEETAAASRQLGDQLQEMIYNVTSLGKLFSVTKHMAANASAESTDYDQRQSLPMEVDTVPIQA